MLLVTISSQIAAHIAPFRTELCPNSAKCEVTALLASPSWWKQLPRCFHRRVGPFVLLFCFSIRCLGGEGLLLPSRYVLWKLLGVASKDSSSSSDFIFSPGLSVSQSIVPVLCYVFVSAPTFFFLLSLFFPPPRNKSKRVWCVFFIPWPTELHETRTSLKNGPDAFHCEERLGKENFEIKFKTRRKELFCSITLNVTIYKLG